MRIIFAAASVAASVVGCTSMSLPEEAMGEMLQYVQFNVQNIMPLDDAASRGIVSQGTRDRYAGTNWHAAELVIVGQDVPAVALIRLNGYPLRTATLEGGVKKLGDDLLVVEWDTKGNNLCLRVEESGYTASAEDRRKLEDGC